MANKKGRWKRAIVSGVSTVLVFAIAMILGFSLQKCIVLPGYEQDGTCCSDADMLGCLLSLGQISQRDGLLVTWYHRANSKEQMKEALSSKSSCQDGAGWGRGGEDGGRVETGLR